MVHYSFASLVRVSVLTIAVAIVLGCVGREASASQCSDLDEARVIEQIYRYCAASWRHAKVPRGEWSDSTQQVLSELIERVSSRRLEIAIFDRHSLERRELKRAIWRITRRLKRAIRFVSLGTLDLPDPSTVQMTGATIEFDDVMRLVADIVTPRQHRILALLSQGCTISDIAFQLGVSPARISDEKYRAIQRIRRFQRTHLVAGRST
jgi:DNA-binding CsgD family transcriptional regulator